MVEQENLFDKEKFKNKRSLKGTPLYSYATRFATKFALALGCLHLSVVVAAYFSNVSEEFLTAGPKQREEKAIQLGMYEYRENDTELRWQSAKEEFKYSRAYDMYEASSYYLGRFKKYFSKDPEDSETSANSSVTKEQPSTSSSPA